MRLDTFPSHSPTSSDYWEVRAQRYATQENGLPAVCSYGMPPFYNRYIDRLQRRALRPWLRSMRGTRVLDIGCGVGRWSIELARHGAHVTGVDVSATMLAEAARQAEAQGVLGNCRFIHADLTQLQIAESFDYVLGVTVLQHILDPKQFAATINTLSKALTPAGRMVLLEVAPSRPTRRCDTRVFTSRSLADWQTALSDAGLRIEHLGGVDPAPFKTQLLPFYRKLPKPIAQAAMALAVALSAPVDLPFARALTHLSWHKIIVATVSHAMPS